MAHLVVSNGADLPRAVGHLTLTIDANGQARPWGQEPSPAPAPWQQLVPPELRANPALIRLVDRTLRERQAGEAPRIEVAPRESRTWFASAVPVGADGATLELVDITASVASVRRAERERGLLILGQFAHQLRNPLAGMLGAMQVFQTDLPRDDIRTKMAEGMIAQGFQLNRLVTDLVLIARDPDVRIESFSMREVIQTVVAELVIRRDIDVTIEGRSVWQSDPRLIRRAVEELVKNALEAMPHGGALHILIDDARLSVCDTGPGVPPEVQAEMLEPMFSTDPGRLGLGLAVAERFCRALELTLTYQSGPNGAGSVFLISAE